MTPEPLIRTVGAARTYGEGPSATVALTPTDVEIWPESEIALVGESGSGKSTLIHLMAGIDDPTLGEVTWPAIGDRGALRPGPVAVVFQGPSLLPPLSVAENVALPLTLAGIEAGETKRRVHEALGRLELDELADKLPEEISGGQAQRVAVARAMAGDPMLILADEPTGQLDHEIGAVVIDQLFAAAERCKAALVVATHDPAVAKRFRESWQMRNGRLDSAKKVATSSR